MVTLESVSPSVSEKPKLDVDNTVVALASEAKETGVAVGASLATAVTLMNTLALAAMPSDAQKFTVALPLKVGPDKKLTGLVWGAR